MPSKQSSLELASIVAHCDATGERSPRTDQVPSKSEKRGRLVSARAAHYSLGIISNIIYTYKNASFVSVNILQNYNSVENFYSLMSIRPL